MKTRRWSTRGVRRSSDRGRWPAGMLVTGLVLVVLVGGLGRARPSQAADFSCAAGDVACLIKAITTANANGEANTITLAAGTYRLTAADNFIDGVPTGLPSITSTLTISGPRARSTIISGNAQFRILYVAAKG